MLTHVRKRYFERAGEHFAHAAPVRALPVHAVASRTMHEARVMQAYAFGHTVDHEIGWGFLEREIAVQAQAERAYTLDERIAGGDFTKLLLRFERMHVASA